MFFYKAVEETVSLKCYEDPHSGINSLSLGKIIKKSEKVKETENYGTADRLCKLM